MAGTNIGGKSDAKSENPREEERRFSIAIRAWVK